MATLVALLASPRTANVTGANYVIGLEVVPLCPFIAHYIERHSEYEQLVASGYRDP